MAEGDAALDAAVKAEWDALKGEIGTRDAQSFQIMTGSITASTALLTLFITLSKDTGHIPQSGLARDIQLPAGLYFIPFAIMLPSLYLILNNVHASERIGSYIETHLESRSGLRWEGALHRLDGCVTAFCEESAANRWFARPLEEAKVMFAVFVGLGLLDALVFFYRGDWSGLPGGRASGVVLMALPFLIYVDAAFRTFSKYSARGKYREFWARLAPKRRSIGRAG